MTKQLRNDFITSHIPIVLLSAKTTIDDKLAGLGYGADDYITKPFSSVYLKARVENLLAQRRKLQEIYVSSLMTNTLDTGFDTTVEKQDVDNEEQNISLRDRKFMDKLLVIVEENMSNSELVVEDLARELAMGRSVFFKKIKSLTGLAPIEFIRELRMKKAAQLILTDEYNMIEVSDMVGINDSRYFSKCFKKIYGMTPSEYKEQNLHKNQ
jgi:AraC-like DNA-binding protein